MFARRLRARRGEVQVQARRGAPHEAGRFSMPALSRIEQVWYYFYVKSRRMSDVAVRGQRPSNSTRTHTPSGGAVCVSFVTLGPPTCFSLFRGSLGFVENTQKSRVSTRRGFHYCSGFSQLLVFFFFSPFSFYHPTPLCNREI